MRAEAGRLEKRRRAFGASGIAEKSQEGDSWKGGRVGMVGAKQRAGGTVLGAGFSVAMSSISEARFGK